MRIIPAVFWIGVVLIFTPCWGRALPWDQQGRPSASSAPHIADDQWAMIESACHNQKLSHSHTAYIDCLSRQVQALEASPGKPSLDSLSGEERAGVEAACKNQRLRQGPAAYYDCLFKQKVIALTAPSKPSTLTGSDDQRPANARASEARPTPHPSSAGSRNSQAASGASTNAPKQPEQPAPRDTSEEPRGVAATPHPTSSQLKILTVIVLAVIAVGLLWRTSRRRQSPARQCQAEEQTRAKQWARQTPPANDSHEQHHDEQPQSEPEDGFDPYVVLQVARNASKEEIRAAYLRQMAKYHPDKVAHLGGDLQELAKHKAQAINRAYEELLQAT